MSSSYPSFGGPGLGRDEGGSSRTTTHLSISEGKEIPASRKAKRKAIGTEEKKSDHRREWNDKGLILVGVGPTSQPQKSCQKGRPTCRIRLR